MPAGAAGEKVSQAHVFAWQMMPAFKSPEKHLDRTWLEATQVGYFSNPMDQFDGKRPKYWRQTGTASQGNRDPLPFLPLANVHNMNRPTSASRRRGCVEIGAVIDHVLTRLFSLPGANPSRGALVCSFSTAWHVVWLFILPDRTASFSMQHSLRSCRRRLRPDS